MSTFDLRKFLTENKLTNNSKLLEVNTPGFDKFADEVEAMFPDDDPRQDQLLDAVHSALIDGEIAPNPNEPSSYYNQVYDIATSLGLVDEIGEEQVEEVEEPVQETEEIVDETNGISKYLALESPEDIVREIEKDITKTTFEAKLSRLREVIGAIDGKVTSLEEDTNLSGFVNTSKIKEMKRTVKKLRSIEEKYAKEYDKKFNK